MHVHEYRKNGSEFGWLGGYTARTRIIQLFNYCRQEQTFLFTLKQGNTFDIANVNRELIPLYRSSIFHSSLIGFNRGLSDYKHWCIMCSGSYVPVV